MPGEKTSLIYQKELSGNVKKKENMIKTKK